MNPKLKKTMTPYGYLMPTLALMMILLVIPIIMVIRYSLYDNVIANKNPVFVGLANYKTVLTDSAFWTAVGHTMFFVIVSIIAHMIIGMIFALILNTRYLHDRTKGIFRAVYALPWMFTASVIAITWRMVLDPNGILNYVLMTLHITSEKITFLASREIALQSVTLINIWSGYPFYMISILAGLQGISPDLYEAAALDGADAVQSFFGVTIPQIGRASCRERV